MNQRHLVASTGAAITSIVFVVVVTIVGELSPEFKALLKGLTSHHWITKSIGSLVVYAVAYPIVYATHRNPTDRSVAGHLWALFVVTLLGIATLTLFFIQHFLAE